MFVDYLKVWIHYKNNSDLPSLRTLKALKRDIQRDLLEAFELGKTAVDEHPDLYDRSSSFVDFLFRLADVPALAPRRGGAGAKRKTSLVIENDDELAKIGDNQTYVRNFLRDLNGGVERLLASVDATFAANRDFFVREQSTLQAHLEHLNEIIARFNESFYTFKGFLSEQQKKSRSRPLATPLAACADSEVRGRTLPGGLFRPDPTPLARSSSATTASVLSDAAAEEEGEARRLGKSRSDSKTQELEIENEELKIENRNLERRSQSVTAELNESKRTSERLRVELEECKGKIKSHEQSMETDDALRPRDATRGASLETERNELELQRARTLEETSRHLAGELKRRECELSSVLQRLENATRERDISEKLYADCRGDLQKCRQREYDADVQMRETEMQNSCLRRERARFDADGASRNEIAEKQIRDLETKLHDEERRNFRLENDFDRLLEKFEKTNAVVAAWAKKFDALISPPPPASSFATRRRKGDSRRRRSDDSTKRSRSRSPLPTDAGGYEDRDLETWFESLHDATSKLDRERRRDDDTRDACPPSGTEKTIASGRRERCLNVLDRLHRLSGRDGIPEGTAAPVDEEAAKLYSEEDSTEDDVGAAVLDAVEEMLSELEIKREETTRMTRMLHLPEHEDELRRKAEELRARFSDAGGEKDLFHYEKIFLQFYEASRATSRCESERASQAKVKEEQEEKEEEEGRGGGGGGGEEGGGEEGGRRLATKKRANTSKKQNSSRKRALDLLKNARMRSRMTAVTSRNKKLTETLNRKKGKLKKLECYAKHVADLRAKLGMSDGSLRELTDKITETWEKINRLIDFFRNVRSRAGAAETEREEADLERLDFSNFQETLQRHFTRTSRERDECVRNFESARSYARRQVRKILSYQTNLPSLSKEEKCVLCEKKIETGETPHRFECDEKHVFHAPCLDLFLDNTNSLPIVCLRDKEELFPDMKFVEATDGVKQQRSKKRRRNSE